MKSVVTRQEEGSWSGLRRIRTLSVSALNTISFHLQALKPFHTRVQIFMTRLPGLWKRTHDDLVVVDQNSVYCVSAVRVQRALGIPANAIMTDIRLGYIPEYCQNEQVSQTIFISTQTQLKAMPAKRKKEGTISVTREDTRA